MTKARPCSIKPWLLAATALSLAAALSTNENVANHQAAADPQAFVTYTSPQGDFECEIPEGWKVWVDAEGGDWLDFMSTVFSDPQHPERMLVVRWYGNYKPHRLWDGMLEMYSSLDDYYSQTQDNVYGGSVVEELHDISKTMGERAQGRVARFIVQSKKPNTCADAKGYSCNTRLLFTDDRKVGDQISTGRHVYTMIYRDSGFYALIHPAPPEAEPKYDRYYQQLVDTFKPSGTGPKGSVVNKAVIYIPAKADDAYNAGRFDEALALYRAGADKGDAYAQVQLGRLYDSGKGVAQDYAEAAKWYRAGAEQGEASGQHRLGLLYKKGLGVSQDYSEALKWFRKAVKQGYGRACNSLGLMYQNGFGVTQDDTEAYKWFMVAAKNEEEDAKVPKSNMEKLAPRMAPEQIAEAQRRADSADWASEPAAPVSPAPQETASFTPQSTRHTEVGGEQPDSLASVWRKTDSSASGFYEKEEEITFNVLDKVSIDPKTGKLSLIGHHDDAYGGPKIPYLEHLATLLEYPQPEFSLHWTSESSERVQAFMDRQLSKEEVDRAVEQWGNWFDEDGKVSGAGRYMLPVFGVHPTDNGEKAGYLGIQVRLGENNNFEITSVEPGSPASRAGLAIGDLLAEDFSAPLYAPKEFYRRVRAAGAGASFKLNAYSGGQWRQVTAVLDAAPGDPWDGVEARDVMERIMRASDNEQGAEVAHAMGIVLNMDESVPLDVRELAYANFMMKIVPDFRAYIDLGEQYRNQQITQRDFSSQVQRWKCEGYEKAFRIPAGTFTRPYEDALGQGQTPEAAFAQATGQNGRKAARLSKEIANTLTVWWDEQWKRPEGIQIAPELVEQALGIHPEMEPEYMNVDNHSQLARLLYESDYLGKRLLNSPALGDKVPGYMTEFAFYRAHPEKQQKALATTSYHMWASLVEVDLARSKDGLTLKTGKADMRFNIRQFGPGRQDMPPVPGGYEELLTAHYDDFARVYPALHELREAAKLAAAANWIRARSASFRLPSDGRSRWDGPAKIPGLLYRYYHPGEDGSSHITTIAAGGISLLPLKPFPRGNADIRIATDEELDASPSPDTVQRLELPTIEGVPVGEPTGQSAGRVSADNEAGSLANPSPGTKSVERGFDRQPRETRLPRPVPAQRRPVPAAPAPSAPLRPLPQPVQQPAPLVPPVSPQPGPQPGANVEAESGPISLPRIPCDPNAAPAAPGRETQLLCITMTCGGSDQAGVCCPGGYPYLSAADCLCYRDRTAVPGDQYAACQYFHPK